MSLVLVSVADGVATLTLNNPAERNTLTAPMVAEIIAAMDVIENDTAVGALVVTGA
ncbi:MAG: enoyl-CoA hydratase-related protein, partial [Actinomycetota bacterium]|nr:enoyl-CoA hydratase-related protein [Actinomycetota bacterium]